MLSFAQIFFFFFKFKWQNTHKIDMANIEFQE